MPSPSFQFASKPHAESESDSVRGCSDNGPIELARGWFGVVGTLRKPVVSLLLFDRLARRFFTEPIFGGGIPPDESIFLD